MINPATLLRDLKRLTATLEADIREVLVSRSDLDASLTQEWQTAQGASRTGATLHDFKAEAVTQAAVHWVLMGVFIRFLEDNALVERPFLTAPDPARRILAQDRHETYFRAHPGHSDREYLLAVYREVARLHGMGPLFDEGHNPLFRLPISGDGAMAILGFWQKLDPDTGALVHDFTDPEWSTRFLGDLYQDLSEAAKKRFALLQTPVFVEELILDRTLDPAIRDFGYREVRCIDPTCGSGHFLLGAFARLLDHWQRNEPARNAVDCAQQALNGVFGVDLNPFAVAIARFRLLIAALQAAGIRSLSEAPNFVIHLAVGDSLLHGPRLGRHQDRSLLDEAETHRGTTLEHAFATEDLLDINRILGQQYHAVVGNPPYITVKDAALNAAYRGRYKTCHMKYSLGVPFTERFFELALAANDHGSAGYVGLITTNSFMKREFGKKLIEEFFPRIDLTHVIDTSGAYIPGHGTPTVILFGRDRPPVGSSVRTVMGIKGEPSAPEDPALGLVWQAIVGQVDLAGSESTYVSVADTPRSTFSRHPWSIGGGGAVELKELIEGAGQTTIGQVVTEIGFGCVISEEEAFADSNAIRLAAATSLVRPIVAGDDVRDWSVAPSGRVLYPYDGDVSLMPEEAVSKALWWGRTVLKARRDFGNRSYQEVGRPWWEYHQIPVDRNRIPLSIAVGEVATHNHFVLDRGGKVFNRTAPVVKLPATAGEDVHLGLLGLLNSSTACFWLKQIAHSKGNGGIGGGIAAEAWERFYVHNATVVAQFPVAESPPIEMAERLDRLALERTALHRATLQAAAVVSRDELDMARIRIQSMRRQMIATQEELDWRCYRLYGLVEIYFNHPTPPEIEFGERAFEIALARRMAAGGEGTSWFVRHGAKPITELPSHWPEDYRRLVEARIALIESDKTMGLIERPEYKRRWAEEPWGVQEDAALRDWLFNRLEDPRYWQASSGEAAALTTTNKLADLARADAEFMQVAELYAARSDFDVAALVAELVSAEAVPLLPVLRYTEAGLRKREAWEQTWVLQRREDAGDAVGDIPVPPKYKSSDFLRADFWRLRGGLDVPKERFVSFPHCSRDADGSLVVAWAGWNQLQLAMAIATYYLDMKENEGWEAARLTPLLAGIDELVPWVKQWYNDPDPQHGTRMGDYLDGFVDEEARSLGLTRQAVRAWQPPVSTTRRGRKKAS